MVLFQFDPRWEFLACYTHGYNDCYCYRNCFSCLIDFDIFIFSLDYVAYIFACSLQKSRRYEFPFSMLACYCRFNSQVCSLSLCVYLFFFAKACSFFNYLHISYIHDWLMIYSFCFSVQAWYWHPGFCPLGTLLHLCFFTAISPVYLFCF